ncbi:hypothetical protein LEM9217_01491 [Leuconostoc mesenteroides]|nr:hypothetical protein LEM9217_01491 [Leuconostoc mesenteroides]
MEADHKTGTSNKIFCSWVNPDSPQEGDLWIPESYHLYKFTNGAWITLVSPSRVPNDDLLVLPQKTSGTHSTVLPLRLGILASLIILMLLLMIL